MAVTAKGTPYVESSDLVANYPGVSLALANHIDTLGKVLQVVSTTKTDTAALSVAALSFTGNLAGLTATITPSAASSKVLISGVINMSRTTDVPFGSFRIMRDSTAVGIGVTTGSRTSLTSSSVASFNGDSAIVAVPFSFLDSPNSTSAIVYAIQGFNIGTSTNTIFINRSPGDANSATYSRTISTITLMEISA